MFVFCGVFSFFFEEVFVLFLVEYAHYDFDALFDEEVVEVDFGIIFEFLFDEFEVVFVVAVFDVVDEFF